MIHLTEHPPRTCLYCHTPLPPEAYYSRLYCNDACKMAAYRARHRYTTQQPCQQNQPKLDEDVEEIMV